MARGRSGASVVAAVLFAAALAGCGGGHEGRPSARVIADPASHLPRAVVTSIARAVVRRVPAPHAGGSTDVRGVSSYALFSGGGLVTEITDHGAVSTTDDGEHWRRARLGPVEQLPSAMRPGVTATIATPPRCRLSSSPARGRGRP